MPTKQGEAAGCPGGWEGREVLKIEEVVPAFSIPDVRQSGKAEAPGMKFPEQHTRPAMGPWAASEAVRARCNVCGEYKAPEARTVSQREIRIRKGFDCSEEVRESRYQIYELDVTSSSTRSHPSFSPRATGENKPAFHFYSRGRCGQRGCPLRGSQGNCSFPSSCSKHLIVPESCSETGDLPRAD